MLPVVDKPAIQYVVEEAVRAGIDDILIITGRNKRSLEDHFDRSAELAAALNAKGKEDQLSEVLRIADIAAIHYLRQGEPLRLGQAANVARRPVRGYSLVLRIGAAIRDERPTGREERLQTLRRRP